MPETKSVPISSLPPALRSIAHVLDKNGNKAVDPADFQTPKGYDTFLDTLSRTNALEHGLRYVPPKVYVGRTVVLDPALGDAEHIVAWAKELAGAPKGGGRIVVVQPGSALHAQAVEWKDRGELVAAVTPAQLSRALIAKRAGDPSDTSADGVALSFVAHPKQAPNIEAFMSTPDTAPVGRLDVKGSTLVGAAVKADMVSVSVRWYVEGFGHLWLEADNAGAYFRPDQVARLQLNYELARSRVHRNAAVIERYAKAGLAIPDAVRRGQTEAAQTLALSAEADSPRGRARHADRALATALRAGEELELAWADRQQRQPEWRRPRFGIDSRHYFLGRWQEIDKYVPKLVDVATITHYTSDTWAPHFEPREGELEWGIREEQFDWLAHYGIEAEARPIFWPHSFVTPPFLAKKTFAELKAYVVAHATAMVKHWGGRITHWEIANEMHDWANVHDLDSGQITELIKLIADTVRKLQPNATLIVNNTNVFGEYAGLGYTAQGASKRPIRTPYQFIRDLIDAGVDFDVIGLQFYHPERDLSDVVRLFERFEQFGKKIRIAEASAPSSPEVSWVSWHGKPFDEHRQADWAETLYRVAGTRRSVGALFWYDISDTRAFVPSGGLLTEDGRPKEAFHRLMALRHEWEQQEATNRAGDTAPA